MLVNDANTTYDFTGTNLKGYDGMNVKAATGDSFDAVYDGTNWHCTFNHLTTVTQNVTQATSKATAVTLDWPCGNITMNNAALAANTTVNFTFNNAMCGANDVCLIDVVGGTANPYKVQANNNGAGVLVVYVTNLTAGSLSEAVVLGFRIFKQ